LDARRYRKRPVEVEAVQVTAENVNDVCGWINDGVDEMKQPDARSAVYERFFFGRPETMVVTVPTLHGDAEAVEGEWVVRGPKGDFWPVRGDIFEESYQEVPEGAWTDEELMGIRPARP
jgi:hypothetical protein